MKRIALISIMILITITGYSQRKLKKLDVKEEGFKIKMNFQPIVDKMTYNGLSISVTPVSADELNAMFYEESFLNGKFNYSYYKKSRQSYFLKKHRGKRKKSQLEFFIDGISWLLDNEKITQEEYDELEKQIIFYFDEDYATQYYSNNKITTTNPYFLNEKYLTVFKIKISNPTSSHIEFDKDLIVENGNTLLNLMSSKNLLKQLDSIGLFNFNKSISLERHNLKRGTILPPNSVTEKLFAILPLNYNNSILNMSLVGVQNKLSWKIEKEEQKINELYKFYEIVLKLKGDSENDLKFSILNGSTNSIYIDEYKLFIGEESLKNTFEIFTISIDGNNLFYGRNGNLKGSDFIDKEKNRRKTIMLDQEKIEELKRKVKE